MPLLENYVGYIVFVNGYSGFFFTFNNTFPGRLTSREGRSPGTHGTAQAVLPGDPGAPKRALDHAKEPRLGLEATYMAVGQNWANPVFFPPQMKNNDYQNMVNLPGMRHSHMAQPTREYQGS